MAYDVERYLGIDAAESPSLTVGGDLLFLADTSGTPQVWRLSEPGAWPERLTPHEERVSFVSASPDRREFVYGMDEGANERDQLYRYDLASGEIERLTDAPEAKHDWGAWSPGGDRIAYTANRRDTGVFDVYVQDREGADPELVHEGEGGWLNVAAWGPDGRRLALLKPRASSEVDLYLLDVETGDVRRLSDDEPARYAHVHFDSRGTGLYLVTDHGADTPYVGRIDLDTGELSRVTGDETAEDGAPADGWPVDGLAHDRRTGRLVYTVNADGYSRLHAGYLVETDEVRENATPPVDGVVSELTFGAQGHRYAFTHTAATDPYGVTVAEYGTEQREDWTPIGTCGLPDDAVRAPETVRYGTFDVDESHSSARETESPDGREIPAYWTLPEDASEGDTPVILDVHGGPEHQRRPWFYPIKQYWLNEGYAVLEPNVRGSTGYGREYAALDDVENRLDSVRDLKAAVEWLHDRPAVDPDRIAIYGRSYGGFMVLSAITRYPDLWAAAVEFVGIANFETFLENTGDWRRSHRESEYGSLDEDRDLLEEISPIHDVDAIECPLFIQHGANDPRVPIDESRQIADALEERGVPVETCFFEDEGHHTTDRENEIEQWEQVVAFLDEYV